MRCAQKAMLSAYLFVQFRRARRVTCTLRSSCVRPYFWAKGELQDDKCSFLFAFGDDYQALGRRFRVKHDRQWDLMWKLLRTSPANNCSVNARIVRATIKGIVERIPATGTIPEDEMGLQIVILSVSGVEPVPIKCTSPSAHSSETGLHEAGHSNSAETALKRFITPTTNRP